MKKASQLKKIISFFTSFTLILALVINFPVIVHADVNDKTFNIIEITDFHGALNDASGNPVAGVLADRIDTVKRNNPSRTLILGGGDLYQGSATSNIMKGAPVQEVMSEIGMEVTALGNHEFDWGLNTIIDTTMKGAKYSIVCSNLYDKKDGKRVFDPYKIIEKDGVRIAIIGGISTETPTIVLPEYVKDYEFRNLTDEINSVAKEIKDSKLADVTIALVHEGDNSDNVTGPIFDMANNLKNVDAVFGGHTHTKVCGSASMTKIPVYIANSYGKGYINAKFTIIDNKKIKFETPTYDNNYVALDNENGYKAKDPITYYKVDKIVDNANEKVAPETNEVIGYNTEKDLTRNRNVEPYGSSVLGNWASDITRLAVKADVGFQNNGGLRIDIPKGEITTGTMWKFMPFDNTIYKFNMTKAQIKEVLEAAVKDGGKGIQVSGIKFTYDSTSPSGNRVKEITREDGREISDSEILSVAAPDFIATGGDGFQTFYNAGGNNPSNDTHIVVRDAFIEWCRENKDKNGENTIANKEVSRIINISNNLVSQEKKAA